MGRMNPSARKIFWSRGLRGASACLCMKYNFHQLLDCSKYVHTLYEELLKDVKGVHMHKQPADPRYDANFWLCAATLDPEARIQGQENAYKEVIKTAVKSILAAHKMDAEESRKNTRAASGEDLVGKPIKGTLKKKPEPTKVATPAKKGTNAKSANKKKKK